MPKVLKQILRRLQSSRLRPRRGFELRSVDSLETRILPTAVVTFNGSAMTIKGDTTANAIALTRVGNQVHVDAGAGFITVNGTDVNDFFFNLNGAFNLTATFQGANDVLAISGPLQFKSVNINMGDGLAVGGDVVAITDVSLTGKLTIDTNNGNDVVALTAVSVTGTTLIDTGWANDVLAMTDCTFTGATTIKTDIGNDVVAVSGVVGRTKFVGKLTLTTGDDVDVVAMTKIDSKAVSIDTSNGADVVALTDWLINGGLSVKTGAGIDVLAMTSIIQSGTGANVFDVGSEADVTVLAGSTLTGATTFNLGSGTANILAIDDVSFNGTFTLNSQGTGDIIAVEQNGGLAGQTTFAKAAKFNFGLANTLVLSAGIGASNTKFLASVAFTGRIPISTVVQGPNVSFAVAPVVKNVLLV
jgi:hypothetical protein